MFHGILDARTATDHFPGIGRYVVHLAQALGRAVPELDVSLLYDPTATATRFTLPAMPRVACPASPFSLHQQWMVPAQLRRLRATLYHSPYYLMPYWPGLPTVLTCYDLIPLVYPQYFSPAQRLIYRLAHHLALRAAAVILAISEATKADLLRYFHLDASRVVVTPLAAGAHFHPQSAERIAAVRQRYALPERYVLYFGSNKPHKNLAGLIQAWHIVHSEAGTSGVKLVIAGHWDERYAGIKRAVEQAGLSNEVIFLGPVSEAELPALYSGAILFVFPSLYEGFGLPVLEAMACGAPVACSDRASLPEMVGTAARLFNPCDANEIAAALMELLRHPDELRRRAGQSLKRAAHFSWERTALRTWEAYQRVQ